jgi:hypothetical protein
MSDIVQQLKMKAVEVEWDLPIMVSGLMEQAAAEIERLRAENEALRNRYDLAERCIGYAITAETTNTPEWLDGLVEWVNRVLAAGSDVQTAVRTRHGIALRTARKENANGNA